MLVRPPQSNITVFEPIFEPSTLQHLLDLGYTEEEIARALRDPLKDESGKKRVWDEVRDYSLTGKKREQDFDDIFPPTVLGRHEVMAAQYSVFLKGAVLPLVNLMFLGELSVIQLYELPEMKQFVFRYQMAVRSVLERISQEPGFKRVLFATFLNLMASYQRPLGIFKGSLGLLKANRDPDGDLSPNDIEYRALMPHHAEAFRYALGPCIRQLTLDLIPLPEGRSEYVSNQFTFETNRPLEEACKKIPMPYMLIARKRGQWKHVDVNQGA